MSGCLGCQLATKELPLHVVYENERICCFLDHDPYNEGHTLILPKAHVSEVDELDEETAIEIMKMSMVIAKALKQLYKPDGITINQNNGIFNELSHYHMHVVSRFSDRSFEDFYAETPLDNGHLQEKLTITRELLRSEIGKIMSDSK
ncbi:HIT family protein [Bacillus suaedaesalsae]|uniref:HIT family protein n=1 Tax=Bacillus suaedaesalsae TaxID=2810349 RepID=A0ABS2DHS4_9BACI|nr:HIT family protein [Bacillus suaedaesalsae]MBM6618037.1 HIT family protein [Bacillus suaedaesalsae]